MVGSAWGAETPERGNEYDPRQKINAAEIKAGSVISVTMEHVQERLPRDPEAFVQGLFYHDGLFIESTGGYGRSSLRRVVPSTGEVLAQHRMAPHLFGEGCALIPNDRIVQLTWRNRLAFVYDAETLRVIKTIPYPREGWGLLFDGRRLLAGDGSHRLYWLDPETLRLLGRIEVHTAAGRKLSGINEMAWVEGKILANIFPTNTIVRIDPASGLVERKWDLTAIADQENRQHPDHVLNGIAYDSLTGRLWITGKCWDHLYLLELP